MQWGEVKPTYLTGAGRQAECPGIELLLGIPGSNSSTGLASPHLLPFATMEHRIATYHPLP